MKDLFDYQEDRNHEKDGDKIHGNAFLPALLNRSTQPEVLTKATASLFLAPEVTVSQTPDNILYCNSRQWAIRLVMQGLRHQ